MTLKQGGKNNLGTRKERIDKMFYGAMVWDPWLIVSQIVCLQCLYYLSLGLFMWVLVGTRVQRLSLLYFFDYSLLTGSTVTGWCIMFAFFLNSLAGAGFMFLLIERARKCLDFAATLYIIHLFICLIYGGWPSSILWWVNNGIGLAVMALLGEWLCIRRELREIPVRNNRSNFVGQECLNDDLCTSDDMYPCCFKPDFVGQECLNDDLCALDDMDRLLL